MAKRNIKIKKNVPVMASSTEVSQDLLPGKLLGDICSFIESEKVNIVTTVNFEMVLLHWKIGKRIRDDIIGEKRADYGKKVVEILGKKLTMEYGKGFGSKSLFHMIKFSEVFPDEEIVSTLSRQLSCRIYNRIASKAGAGS